MSATEEVKSVKIGSFTLTNEDKIARLCLNEGVSVISASRYNLIIGLVMLWGIVLNIVSVVTASSFFLGFLDSHPFLFFLSYFALIFGGSFIANVSSKPIISFLGFTMVAFALGGVLSVVVPMFSLAIVIKAFCLTGIVTFLMLTASQLYSNFFLSLGRTLFFTLIVGIIAELVATFVFGYAGSAFDWIFVILFSLYLGFDFAKAQIYAKTVDNAIDSALDIYMDIVILFMRILSILGKRD